MDVAAFSGIAEALGCDGEATSRRESHVVAGDEFDPSARFTRGVDLVVYRYGTTIRGKQEGLRCGIATDRDIPGSQAEVHGAGEASVF